MSEIREKLVDAMEKVVDGKMPLDTAEGVHHLAYDHSRDRSEDDKEARRIGEIKIFQGVEEAQKKIEAI